MKIRLIAYGIAKEILQSKETIIEVPVGTTIAALKQALHERYPDFASLQSLSFAVDEDYQKDSFALTENDEVVIIPPVSGG